MTGHQFISKDGNCWEYFGDAGRFGIYTWSIQTDTRWCCLPISNDRAPLCRWHDATNSTTPSPANTSTPTTCYATRSYRLCQVSTNHDNVTATKPFSTTRSADNNQPAGQSEREQWQQSERPQSEAIVDSQNNSPNNSETILFGELFGEAEPALWGIVWELFQNCLRF